MTARDSAPGSRTVDGKWKNLPWSGLPSAGVTVKPGTLCDEGAKLLQGLSDGVRGQPADESRLPGPPIQTPDLIGEDDPVHGETFGNRHFKGIPFCPARDRTEDRQPHPRVVSRRRHNQRRTPARLLTASLRGQRNPNHITPSGGVSTRHLFRLPPDRRSPVNLGVDIVLGDPRK